MMAGFYIQHNTSIGLRCFAWGILFGIGSLYQLSSMRSSSARHLAHGDETSRPEFLYFRDCAFVLRTDRDRGLGARRASTGLGTYRHPGAVPRFFPETRSMPCASAALGTSVVLFVLAAFVEGYVSGSALPYSLKASVAL